MIKNLALLNNIKSVHIRLEKILQMVAANILSKECSECTDICCKKKFCQESMDSTFLLFILGKQAKLYSKTDGWLTMDQGCSTPFGRPPVCYEFFCSKFKNDKYINDLKFFSGLFKKIYNNTHGNQHMVVLKSLETITNYRLGKILNDLQDLEQNILNTFSHLQPAIP
jgi:hypothetical protein